MKGFSAERFMNMAAYRGVYLWEVAREGAGMTMKQPVAFAGVCRKNGLCAGGAFLWRSARFSGAIWQAAGLDGRAFVLCGRAVSSVLVCLGNAD